MKKTDDIEIDNKNKKLSNKDKQIDKNKVKEQINKTIIKKQIEKTDDKTKKKIDDSDKKTKEIEKQSPLKTKKTNKELTKENQLNKLTKKQIDDQTDKIATQSSKILVKKQLQMQSEIKSAFQMSYDKSVQEVFLKTYGNNYDVKSLTKSYSYGIDNDLRPKVSYDRKAFRFNTTIKNDERAFNENATKQGSFRNTMQDPEMFMGVGSEFNFNAAKHTEKDYDHSAPYTEAKNSILGNNATQDWNIFSPHNRMNRTGGFTPLKVAYEKADEQAKKNFQDEYIKTIKPKLDKKYGLADQVTKKLTGKDNVLKLKAIDKNQDISSDNANENDSSKKLQPIKKAQVQQNINKIKNTDS